MAAAEEILEDYLEGDADAAQVDSKSDAKTKYAVAVGCPGVVCW
jgi:hypothetical protein